MIITPNSVVSNLSCVGLSVAYVLVNWAVNTGDTHSVEVHFSEYMHGASGTKKHPARKHDKVTYLFSRGYIYIQCIPELFNKFFPSLSYDKRFTNT